MARRTVVWPAARMDEFQLRAVSTRYGVDLIYDMTAAGGCLLGDRSSGRAGQMAQ